jgi:hypothetical protein
VVSSDPPAEPISLQVEVLPFTLDPLPVPVALFGMEASMFPLLAAYGFNALCGGPSLDVLGWDETGAPQLRSEHSDRALQAAARHGLTNAVFAYTGPARIGGVGFETAETVFARWGQDAGLDAATSAQRLLAARRDLARLHSWPPLSWCAADEPRVRGQAERVLASIRFLKQADPALRSMGFFSASLGQRDDPFLHQALFHELDAVVLNSHSALELAEARRLGKEVYLYNQGRSRYTFGLYLWNEVHAGAMGLVQWHAWLVHGYQFFDLDGREPDAGLLVRTPDGWRPTLDLERARQGIYDYRYLVTLERLLREATGTPAAAEAERYLEGLRARHVVGSKWKPDDINLDELREQVVHYLLQLHAGASR